MSNVEIAPAATDAVQLEKQFQRSVAPFLESFCRDCHGGDEPAAKLDLSGYSSAEQIAKEHQTWTIVLDRLRAGEMPPRDSEPQPTDKQRQSVTQWIESELRRARRSLSGDTEEVVLRRLNRSLQSGPGRSGKLQWNRLGFVQRLAISSERRRHGYLLVPQLKS